MPSNGPQRVGRQPQCRRRIPSGTFGWPSYLQKDCHLNIYWAHKKITKKTMESRNVLMEPHNLNLTSMDSRTYEDSCHREIDLTNAIWILGFMLFHVGIRLCNIFNAPLMCDACNKKYRGRNFSKRQICCCFHLPPNRRLFVQCVCGYIQFLPAMWATKCL